MEQQTLQQALLEVQRLERERLDLVKPVLTPLASTNKQIQDLETHKMSINQTDLNQY
jgi:hypothetical protein